MAKGRHIKITVTPDGPYVVEGGIGLAHQHIVTNRRRESLGWREGETVSTPDTYRLCRCGRSAGKPFCDGTHARIRFDGTETASRAPVSQQAERIDGPEMILEDTESLCALARFCHPHGGIWDLVNRTNRPRSRELVEQEAADCPAGRLVARDRTTGRVLEPELEPSIGLVQDTAKHVSGPLWVRGRIPIIGSGGVPYEVRNRVTLCRCGASGNKPFCDGSHVSTRFKDR
jgi:CDGSH-type Zn-finger protein